MVVVVASRAAACAALAVMAFAAPPPIYYISTVAGNGSKSHAFPANGAPATSVALPLVQSVVDEHGDLIAVSMSLNAAFKVNLREGTLGAFAGTGRGGFAGAWCGPAGPCCAACKQVCAARGTATNESAPSAPQATADPRRLRCSMAPCARVCVPVMAPSSSSTSSRTTVSGRCIETRLSRQSRGMVTTVCARPRSRDLILVSECRLWPRRTPPHPCASCRRLPRRGGPAAG